MLKNVIFKQIISEFYFYLNKSIFDANIVFLLFIADLSRTFDDIYSSVS